MKAIPFEALAEAMKHGSEAVASLLSAAGVELAGLPKDLRRKLRGEAPEAPAAKADATPKREAKG